MSDNMPLMNGNGVTPVDDPSIPSLVNTTPVGTDFKAVAIGAGANLEALPAYFTDPLLGTGNMPGIAISAFNNRALRQGTFVASSLCLWISGQTQVYVPDNGDQVAWMASWQQALANFVTALIPAGPNLGAYLPLAGGTMVGNIRFQSGISTILANNTWYFGLDTGGTARGLIIKGSDNNITINDGSALNVTIAGAPVANNNYSWSGKNTSGTIVPLIGLLSDNNVHIAGAANIYLDGTVWVSGNLALNNNSFVYGKDTGGTARAILGINNGNSLLVGSSVTGSTDIYAGGGQAIYFHNNTTSLGVFQVNGFTYVQGGGRAYIAGGNDPWQVYADHGYYARIYYTVGGTRSWTLGIVPSGNWTLADESAAAVRFQIDTGGTATFYGACNINGGSTIYNGLNVASGNSNFQQITVQGGTYSYGGLNVWNSLNMNSGNINAGGVQIYGGYLYSYGDGQINGNLWCSNQTSSNTIITNYLRDNGDMSITGGLTVGYTVNAGNAIYANRAIIMYSDALYAYNNTVLVPQPDGGGYVGIGSAGWAGMFAFGFYVRSDERDKTGITPVPSGCLDAVRQIAPQSYRLRDKLGGRGTAMTSTMLQEADANAPPTDPHPDQVIVDRMAEMEKIRTRLHWGFLAQDVGRVMQESGLDFGGHLICDDCDTESLGVVDMLAVLWAAVRELSDKLEQAEGKLASLH
jgi:hypothetical protein